MMSKRSQKKKWIAVALPALGLLGVLVYLFTPPSYKHLSSARFDPLPMGPADGKLVPLAIAPRTIYGMGLTYRSHIQETASPYDPAVPPIIFRKEPVSWNPAAGPVKVPSAREMSSRVEALEPGLGQRVSKRFPDLPPLLDYEGELAFAVLSDIDWRRIQNPDYAPELGYFLANDLSVRTLAVLGEGRDNRHAFWGLSKSFPRFLPVGKQMWVPNHAHANSVLAVTLTTYVNGSIRQRQSTTDMIYTPKQMLQFIAKVYPRHLPQKGDVVLTGTPGGVALQIPGWKAKLGQMLNLDRFIKLAAIVRANRNNDKFLKPGDQVVITGGILGEVRTQIVQ